MLRGMRKDGVMGLDDEHDEQGDIGDTVLLKDAGSGNGQDLSLPAVISNPIG